MSKMSPVSRNRLLLGASVTALVLGATPALADAASNPFARVANPAAAIAQAAQAQLTQTENSSAASQRALAAFAQASAIRAQMDATQMAARAAVQAAQASVPNGLTTGGLQPTAGATPGTPLWLNASAPTQSTSSDGRSEVAVQQTAPQAILNWQTFNVGQKTDVNFNQQGNASWVVLNRVNDPSANPTQILGTVKAPGTVMIMNRNGVIFGNQSQVNVGNLVAAAASISDGQFLNNGIYSTQSGGLYVPSITDALGQVKVEAGAQITTNTPASVLNGGGYVMLLGGSVENDGSINTPMGQTLLAAGDAFNLRPGFGTDGNGASTTKGSEVAPVIDTNSANGTVTNAGDIFSQQGDITLAGRTVTQVGVALSTTSVNQRGTIHLLNSTSDSKGSVTLAANSLTAILPELGSTTTALDAQRDQLISASGINPEATAQFDNLSTITDRKDQSRVEIVTGGNVDFQNLSFTLAQGGQIAVSAAKRVFNESGAWLDVSGVRDVALDVSNNDIEVNVQGNELRDAPVNRDDPNQPLYNQDVWIDTRDLVLVPAGTGGYATDRYYTTGGLLEVSGELGNTGHTIGEWDAVGGTITLQASEVVAESTSMFNVAGGSLKYAGGTVMQTLLKGADGKIYTANNAPADIDIVSVGEGFQVLHPRWGDQYTENFQSSFVPSTVAQYQPGYIVGRDAGLLILSAPTVIFNGDIDAEVVNGVDQTSARPNSVSDPYKLGQLQTALPGGIYVGQYVAGTTSLGFQTDIEIGVSNNVPTAPAIGQAIDPSTVNTAIFDASQLSGAGLGAFTAVSAESIAVTAPLSTAAGGSITLLAPRVDISANLTARGGAVTAGNANSHAAGQDGLADVSLDQGAMIDVRGLWTNSVLGTGDSSGLPFVNGGSVDFQSTQNVSIASGSSIDASSGGAILSNGKTVSGAGGDVTLAAGIGGAQVLHTTSDLTLDGSVASFGVNGGGTLTLKSNAVSIGEATDGVAIPLSGTVLNLPASFFRSGFSDYDVTGYTGVAVLDGANIDVTMPVLRFTGGSALVASGNAPTSALQLWTPPVYLGNPITGTLTQRKGASISLHSVSDALTEATAIDRGVSPVAFSTLSLGNNAALSVDPGQSISLEAWGDITVDGALDAPGGNISIVNSRPLNLTATADPLGLSIWIGPNGHIDATAKAVTALDQFGRPYGVAPSGGTITIGSQGGPNNTLENMAPSTEAFIVIRPGATIEASGSSAAVDLAAGSASQVPSQPTLLAGSGGTISLSSYSGLYLDGTVEAFSGGASAAGGTLNVTLDTPVYNPQRLDPPQTTQAIPSSALFERILTVAEDVGPSALSADAVQDTAASELQVGVGRVGVDQIAGGGFDSVSLWGRDGIRFDGNVSLTMGRSIALQQGAVSASSVNDQVLLSAPYVLLQGGAGVLANPDRGDVKPNTLRSPLVTGADFTVKADLIDLAGTGRLLFSQVNLTSQTDIRFAADTVTKNGANYSLFQAPNQVNLSAEQIYPETNVLGGFLAGLTFAQASDPLFASGSRLAISSVDGVIPVAPQSAFGELLFGAEEVDQSGILRAPMGAIGLGITGVGLSTTTLSSINGLDNSNGPGTGIVNLLPGSITSTSGAGIVMPYGGTSDGLAYDYAGIPVTTLPVADMLDRFGTIAHGVAFGSQSVDISQGATLDISGGGTLTGAGFLSGRGGSVDVLRNGLASAGPAYALAGGGTQVYAIVPSYSSNYAPMGADVGDAQPRVGQQVTIGAGIPGLAPGKYTLLPSTYALLPGAFRVEIGATNGKLSGVSKLGDGSYVTGGYLGIANTNIQTALPAQLILSPAATVRVHSQYTETSYEDFELAQTAQFGQLRPWLPEDAGSLILNFGSVPGTDPALTVSGNVLTNPATGGYGSQVALVGGGASSNGMEILADGGTANGQDLALNASDINALKAATLLVGNELATLNGDQQTLSPTNGSIETVIVGAGAILSAAQIFLIAENNIVVESGARLDTTSNTTATWDSSDGYQIFNNGAVSQGIPKGPAILAVSNQALSFRAPIGAGSITIADQTSLLGRGTIVFDAPGSLTLDNTTILGAKDIVIALPSVNIGTADTLAQAGAMLPVGWSLTQQSLDQLINGDPAHNVPGLQTLDLTATNSVNFFGSVDINTRGAGTGAGVTLILTTPAVYGFGTSSDVATLTTGNLVWNGLSQAVEGNTIADVLPGATSPGGIGSGASILNIVANQITFGYPDGVLPQDEVPLDRLILGFSAVNLSAAQSITANSRGSLSVYQSGPNPNVAFDPTTYVGVGGSLSMNTPLLTGEAGSVMSYKTSGILSLSAPTGSAAIDSSTISALGAEVDLAGDTVSVNSVVALPSGRLVVDANNDIDLGAGANLDLSGRAIPFFDQVKYAPGGAAILESAHGNVSQDAASLIDVSAVNADAGSLSVTATDAAAGHVLLAGRVIGSTSEGFAAGGINIRAQTLGDFAALNMMLNSGGLFGSRGFEIMQGDLSVGDEVRANDVDISIDGGSLTVTGTINASGAGPGTIRLASRDDLTLASNAVLDGHAKVLQTDSNGAPIEAENRGHIELTTSAGSLVLASGATLDLSTPDGLNYGDVELDAPRTSETGGDIRVSAAGPLTIKGAQTIALNGFWTYSPTDSAGTIVQDNGATSPVGPDGRVGLNQIDQQNQLFVNAALGNADLLGRIAGLSAYVDAFHLRPGVEIVSAGDLTTSGDLDFSGFRYSSLNPNSQKTGVYGSGEPGYFIARASGDIHVNGSVSDGFFPIPGAPFGPIVTVGGTTLESGGALPTSVTFNDFPAPAPGYTGYGLCGSVVCGNYFYFPGYVSGDTSVQPVIVQGEVDDPNAPFGARTLVAGDTITYFTRGAVFAAGTILSFPGQVAGTQEFSFGGTQQPSAVSVPALDPLLAAGSPSWNFRLVAGANLNAADTRSVKSLSSLTTGNLILNDPHTQVLTDSSGQTQSIAYPSVLRTGTGSLDLIAGGNFQENSLFGVYTAGTQAADVTPEFQASRAVSADGTLFGNLNSLYADAVSSYQANYPEHGGDFYLAAQGSVSGDVTYDSNSGDGYLPSDTIGQWLWRQGGNGIPAAWWINFGTFALSTDLTDTSVGTPLITAFSGMGTLGGGNATVIAGGNAGEGIGFATDSPNGTTALNIVVAGSGRVVNNQLVQTGGGNLVVQVGGDLNRNVPPGNASSSAILSFPDDTHGVFLDLRGNIDLNARSIGRIDTTSLGVPNDPRLNDVSTASNATANGGPIISVGDGSATVHTLGDLVLGGTVDPGTVSQQNATLMAYLPFVLGAGEAVARPITLAQPYTLHAGEKVPVDYFDEVGGAVVTAGTPLPAPFVNNSTNITLMTSYQVPQGGVVVDNHNNLFVSGAFLNPGVVIVAMSLPAGATFPQDLLVGATEVPYGAGQTLSADLTLRAGTVLPSGISLTAPASIAAGDGDVISTFSLWTPHSAISLFSAGGDLTPSTAFANLSRVDDGSVFPGTFRAVAASGDIISGGGNFETAPSPIGQLELLAAGSIQGNGLAFGGGGTEFSVSGAPLSSIATPINPEFTIVNPGALPTTPGATTFDPSVVIQTNSFFSPNNINFSPGSIFQFGPDSASGTLHTADPEPARIYAVNGDITNFSYGEEYQNLQQICVSSCSTSVASTNYISGKAAQIRAGQDIVNFGSPRDPNLSGIANINSGLFLNSNPTDVSVISAGRDIWYANAAVAGPGELDVSAGRNVYQGAQGILESIGPVGTIVSNNRDSGASISILAGVGASGPDYTDFAKLYLDPANLADPNQPLADQPGKVFETYNDQLYSWLQQRFAYTGSATDVLAYFLALPADQQGIFVREVYFDELTAGGREFNDPTSRLFRSYLRGRDAIAALFPDNNQDSGSLTLFSGNVTLPGAHESTALDSSISTDFGGNIQILTPHGGTTLGANGAVPGPLAGILTQGTGDIQIYADQSILLGLSRIFTTFGGNILAWSAEGDINAGRGSKGTVVFTPASITYDPYGNIALAPTVPSSGAGIATLDPIPEVKAGDVDLIAPLGTVDAGEAGIRVSGNVNIAALHIVNAANIQVKGTATGLPEAVAVNTGALTAASSAASAVTQLADRMVPRPVPMAVPMILTVQFLGFGE